MIVINYVRGKIVGLTGLASGAKFRSRQQNLASGLASWKMEIATTTRRERVFYRRLHPHIFALWWGVQGRLRSDRLISPVTPTLYVSPPLIGVSGGDLPVIGDHVMKTAIAIASESPKVFSKDGRLVTTTREVADYFDKQHQHITQKVESLDCSEQFLTSNFSLVNYQHNGNTYKMYELTKDGFMFLVMGFTGKKAARLKEAYIAKFNKMEAELSRPVAQPGYSELVITLQNGQPVCSRVGQPGEFMSTLEGHTEMLRRAGYVVTHCDDLELLTVADLAKRADEARRLMNKWLAITNN